MEFVFRAKDEAVHGAAGKYHEQQRESSNDMSSKVEHGAKEMKHKTQKKMA